MPALRITAKGAEARSLQLRAQAVTLGRATDNGLTFPNDAVLSRRHLSVEPENGRWFASDLGSKNGTLLNGKPLTIRTELRDGDILTAGGVTLFYSEDAPLPELEKTVVFSPAREDDSTTRASVRMSLQQAVAGPELTSVLSAPSITGAPRVQLLLEAGRELAGHRPLDELFGRILELALSAVGAERGVLMTLDGSDLHVRAARGEGFRISTAVRDRVLQGRESLLVVDTSQDLALAASQTIVSSGTRSLIAVPLQTEDTVIGLLYLDASRFLRSFSHEDLTLVTVLANIAAVRIQHARFIEMVQAEKVIQHELRQAAEIQRGLFPLDSPSFPGYDIAGLSVPCHAVGGDYFDYVHLQGGRLGVLLGDVSGKGLSAALLLAGLQARVHLLAEQSSTADELMCKLNPRIAAAWPGNRFMTLCIFVFEPATGEFTYCNAGHNPPFLLRSSGQVETLTVGGPVMGILKNAPFSAGSGVLHPGDTILLYTDGASEAENPAGKDLGEDGVLQLFQDAGPMPPADLIRHVYRAVSDHLSGAPAADDCTLLAIRRV